MRSDGWILRVKLIAQRFWQPTTACLTCMPGSLGNFVSAAHWEIALSTGLVTGTLVLLLSLTRFVSVLRNRYGNCITVGGLTALGDAYAHENHYGMLHAEALLTGLVSGILALAGSFLLEDRARRPRAAWRRLTGSRTS